jgi:hypothetical protein
MDGACAREKAYVVTLVCAIVWRKRQKVRATIAGEESGSLIGQSLSVFGFRLTIQNITNRHVSNAFDLIAVFISFPWRAAVLRCQLERTRSSAQRARTRVLRYWRLQKNKIKKREQKRKF